LDILFIFIFLDAQPADVLEYVVILSYDTIVEFYDLRPIRFSSSFGTALLATGFLYRIVYEQEHPSIVQIVIYFFGFWTIT
jgi:hypothetical protein